jgi:hypothetical protein
MKLAAFTCLLLLAAASAVYAEEKDVTELKIETTRECASKRARQIHQLCCSVVVLVAL